MVYLDAGLLRGSGILAMLAGSKSVEDLEYKQFVDGTHFDYRRDLDRAAIEFSGDTVYFALRGRFDWPALTAYTNAHGGKCVNGFCQIAGSQPGRTISFYPLRPNTMALGTGSDPWAAGLVAMRPAAGFVAPPQPIWISVPGDSLRNASALPDGTRIFARAIGTASDRVVFSLGAKGQRLELALDANCKSEELAALLNSQLQKATELLQKMLARENQQPGPKDLARVLTAGTFKQEKQRVTGAWPIERAFVEALASGGAQ